MEPLPQTKVGNLLPIFNSMVKEANLEERSSGQHCLARLIHGYSLQGMDAYVDDTDNPKHVIIFGKFPGIVTNEMLGVVLFIYSIPEDRGSAESLAAFREQIDAYAQASQVDSLLGSDWQFRGTAMGVGKFWRECGFERQETTYVRVIKKSLAQIPMPPAS